MGRGKNAENYAKHGIDFERACWAFRDPFAIERLDERENYGEDRVILIGMTEGVVLFERASRLRLISARRATKREQDDYFAQNA
jgi:uncharacterized protein